MSKNFGKSRASVFERLGSRDISRDNYGSPPVRRETKPGHHNSMGRDSRGPRGVGIEGKEKRRSQSFSPPPSAKMSRLEPTRKKFDQFDDSVPSHSLKPSKPRLSGGNIASNRPVSKKAIKESTKHNKVAKSDQKHSSKKDKEKKRSGIGSSKKSLEKKKKKGRSSSVSSGDSSAEGSYSSSSSKSSSSSSSSSSNNSSSSESSVPSVKLKSEKSKLKKKKLKSKNEKKAPTPKPTSSSRSSSSGMDHGSNSMPLKRTPIDLREKLNARSPSGLKEQQYHPKDSRIRSTPTKRIKPYDNESPVPEDDRYLPKKRAFPQDPYIPDDVKRRRLSPPPGDKFRPPIDNSPHHHRRAPPQQLHEPPKRRTPPGFQKEQHMQRGGPMPQQRRMRPDEQLQRRPDFRNDGGDKRNSQFNQGMKPREFDRHREPDFGGRDQHRPRERVAPSRPPIDNRQDRDRNPQMDFQRRGRIPPFHPSDHNRGGGGGGGFRGQGPLERERPRFGGGAGQMEERTKHMPLLPKSKEALAERYEMMKKSGYVDKWVDETVKTVQVQRKGEDIVEPIRAPLLPLPTSRPTSYPLLSSQISTVESIEKPKVVEDSSSVKEIPDKIIVEAEDLSDFSDDADEILNNEESPKDSAGPGETPSASDMDESQKREPIESPSIIGTPVQGRSESIEKAPSIASQDRTVTKVFIPDGKSLPSQSQTDDDILEQMDFEEISEDELAEVENKVHIVDALGVDWASLVCQEKKSEPQAAVSGSASSSARKRWNPLQMLSRVGVSKSLAGEKLYQRIVDMKNQTETSMELQTLEEAQLQQNKSVVDSSKSSMQVLDVLGLGPNSRALSSRRDMAVRRCFLGLPRKSLLSMDLKHQSSSNILPPEMTSVGELYKLSIALFKPLKEATTLV